MKFFWALIFVVCPSLVDSMPSFALKKATVNVENDSVHFYQLMNDMKLQYENEVINSENFLRKPLRFANSKKRLDWVNYCYEEGSRLLTDSHISENLKLSLILNYKAYAHFDSLKNHSFAILALNRLAVGNRQLARYPEALRWAYKGIELGKKTGVDENQPSVIGKLYGNLANIYYNIKLADSAINNYDRAIKCFSDSSNLRNRLKCQYGKGMVLWGFYEDYETAVVILRNTSKGYLKINDKRGMALCENLMGTICRDSKAYHQALKNYGKALELSKESKDMRMYAGILNNIGIVEKLLGNYERSKKNAIESLKLADSLGFSYIVMMSHHLLHGISLSTGDTINSFLHFNQAVRLKDSLYNTKDFQEIVGTITKNQNEKYEQNVLVYDKLLTRRDFWLWAIIFLALSVMVAVFFILRKSKNRLLDAKNRETDLVQTVETQKREKDHLNRELVSVTANLAMKGEALKRAKSTLQKLEHYVRKENILAETRETKKSIGDALMLDKMWETFFLHFNEVYPGFYEALQTRYKLSNTELKICAFIKMNLTNKEICQIVNLSQKSIPTTMHRLKNKFKLSKTDNVRDFINNYKARKEGENEVVDHIL